MFYLSKCLSRLVGVVVVADEWRFGGWWISGFGLSGLFGVSGVDAISGFGIGVIGILLIYVLC
mgnify:CR=1 FL=1